MLYTNTYFCRFSLKARTTHCICGFTWNQRRIPRRSPKRWPNYRSMWIRWLTLRWETKRTRSGLEWDSVPTSTNRWGDGNCLLMVNHTAVQYNRYKIYNLNISPENLNQKVSVCTVYVTGVVNGAICSDSHGFCI